RIRGLADTRYRRERTVDQANDRANLDPVHRFTQRITAQLSSLADDVSAGLQLRKNLFEKFDRQLFLGRELTDLENGTPELHGNSKIDQCAHRIFPAFGKFHVLFADSTLSAQPGKQLEFE